MKTRLSPLTLLGAAIGGFAVLLTACPEVEPTDEVEVVTEEEEEVTDIDPDLPELRIGVPLSFTGPVAESAREAQEVFLMYVEQQGGTLGGLPVRLIFEDTETEAETVVTRARKLIDTDDVHLLSGTMLAFEGLAMADTVARDEIAFVGAAGVVADDHTRMDNPFILGTGKAASQETMPLGHYAYEELGYRRVAILGQDYEWGWQTTGGFQYAFEAAGGEVVQKLWAPLGTTDYAPFVTELERDVDAIYATVVGADVPRFVEAYSNFGLKDEIPLLGSEDLVAEDAMRYFGDEAIGITGTSPFSANIDRPEMQQFVEAYRERTGDIPTFWGDNAYTAVLTIDHILWYLREQEGIPPEELPEFVRNNAEEFIAAAGQIELNAPASEILWDEYSWPIRNMYIVEIVATDDGGLTDEIVHIYEDSRFHWTFDPEEFIALPVFSREFPPVD